MRLKKVLRENTEVRVEAVEEVVTIPTANCRKIGANRLLERLRMGLGSHRETRSRNVPDVFVGDDEGFAEWLGGVEPDSGVFLCCGGRLTRDGARSHVQSAGYGRQQRLV